MKKTLVILSISFLFSLIVHGQDSMNSFMDRYRSVKAVDGKFGLLRLGLSDIQGTPYLNDQFAEGKITNNKGVIYQPIMLRYNCYSDNLEFKNGEVVMNIDPKSTVKRADFDGVKLGCFQYHNRGKIEDGFFEVLVDGKAILLVKHIVRFLEPEPAKAYQDPKPARFEEPVSILYISIDGQIAEELGNKKELLSRFGDKKEEMENYISRQKLGTKNSKDLIQIIGHFNGL